MADIVAIAKHDDLPFDVILTAELARSVKPDPKVYELAPRYLGLRPDEILMVACHKVDLRGAKAERRLAVLLAASRGDLTRSCQAAAPARDTSLWRSTRRRHVVGGASAVAPKRGSARICESCRSVRRTGPRPHGCAPGAVRRPRRRR